MTSATSDAVRTTGVQHSKHRRATTRGVSALMYASQQGDVQRVRKIIQEQSSTLLTRDRTGKTPLHYCCTSDNICAAQAADLLVMAAPDLVESRDEDGFTPLHLAVIAGNMPLVTFLLANKADVNAVDNEKHTVVHWATVCGETAALRAVLAAGAPVSTPDVHGGYPLHYAAQMCGGEKDSSLGLQVLQTLLTHSDIVVPVEDGDGRQPLLWAASAGSAKAVLALIRAGAAVEASDKDGLTALHCAASRGHTDCIDSLLTLCGASPDVIDTNGCTALHYAVTLGHADATALLLVHGTDPNRQDRKGRTPAHCGCAKGQFETVKMISSHGANLWLRNARGDLPLHEAAASGRRDLVRWLLDMRPSQVNARNNDGRCPLHLAALNDNADMCKILLDAGAQINPILRTSKNTFMTPLDCALQRGFRSTAKYLQLHGGVPANRLGDIRHNQVNPGINMQIKEDITFWGDTSSDSERENGEATKHSKRVQRKKLSHKYEKKKASLSGSEPEIPKYISNKYESSKSSRRRFGEKSQRSRTGGRTDSATSVDVSRQTNRKTPSGRIDYTNGITINGNTEINIHQTKQININDEAVSTKLPSELSTEVAEKVLSEVTVDKEKRPKSAKHAKVREKSGKSTGKEDSAKRRSKNDRPNSKQKQGNSEQSKQNEITEEDVVRVAKEIVDKNDNRLVPDNVVTETNGTDTIKKTKLADQQSLMSNTSEDIEEHKSLVVEAAVHEPPKLPEKFDDTNEQHIKANIEEEEETSTKEIQEEKKETNEKPSEEMTIGNEDKVDEIYQGTEETIAAVNTEEKETEEVQLPSSEEATIGAKNDNETLVSETKDPESTEEPLQIENKIEPEAMQPEEQKLESDAEANVDVKKNQDDTQTATEVQDTSEESKTEEVNGSETISKQPTIENIPLKESVDKGNGSLDEKIEAPEPKGETEPETKSDGETEKTIETETKSSGEPEEKKETDNVTEVTVDENNTESQETTEKFPTTEDDKPESLKTDSEDKETTEKVEKSQIEEEKFDKRKSKRKNHRTKRQSSKDQAYEIIYKTIGADESDDVTEELLSNREETNEKRSKLKPQKTISETKSSEEEYSTDLDSESSTSTSLTVKEHKSFRILDDKEAEEIETIKSKSKKVSRKVKSPPKKQRSRSEENKKIKDTTKENDKVRKNKIASLSKSNLSKSDKYLNIPDRKTKSSMESRVPSLPNINENKDRIKEPPRPESNMSAPLLASIYSDNEKASASDLEEEEEKRSSATRRKKVKRRSKMREARSAGSDYESSNVIDSGFEPSPRSSRIPKWKNMTERGVNMTSVTQTIQSNIRRYHLERKIFQHLLDLKRMQIRAGQHNEALLVKRAIDSYHQSCAATVGAGRYVPEDYTFRSFEKFLYLSLRKLQRNGADHLKGLPESSANPLLCTQSTHRCMHATHAYTGIPCAAYLPKMDHHTIPKIGFTSTQCKPGTGFLPTINPKKAVTLELCHGNDKQVISLPADRLDQNKRYYVTFTVKGSEHTPPNEETASSGHRHSKSD